MISGLGGCFWIWGSEVVAEYSEVVAEYSEVVAEYWKRHVAQARSRGITICSFRMMKICQEQIPFS
ncbi:MAG: hypothetical protein EBV34_14390 [Betaproteobacteria bacterium]|nr:hypothetical protein [Betaproteobacteria bacterium]